MIAILICHEIVLTIELKNDCFEVPYRGIGYKMGYRLVDQIQYGRLVTIIYFNTPDIWQTIPDS